MRNDVPGGEKGFLVPPPGVQRAGGAEGRVLIERLRAQIRVLEQVPVSLALSPAPGAAPPRPACSPSFSGLAAISPPSPCKGLDKLKRGGLHEIKPEAYRDVPATLGFALAVIAEAVARAKRRALVLWCLTKDAAREWGCPYGPGLIGLGLDPATFLIVEARNAQDAAWALEEGLKSRVLIAALAEMSIDTPLIARRLGLAAQASRTPCLLLSPPRDAGVPGSLTRWRIATAKSAPAPFDASAPGAASWHLTLDRCRGEAPGRSWRVEFSHESNRLRVAAEFLDRAAEAGEPGQVRSG